MESNLNRSFSAPDITSEPICRRVFIEEFYYTKNSLYPLRKQISCEQFPVFTGRESKYLPIENIPIKKEILDHPNDIVNKTYIDSVKPNSLMFYDSKFDDSPMDIDFDESANDLQTKISDNVGPIETSTPTTLQNCKVTYKGRMSIITKTDPDNPKPGCRRLTGENVTKKKDEVPTNIEEKKTKKKSRWPVIITILIGIAMVPIYDHYNYNRKIDIEKIKIDLVNSVVNQDDQISQIMNTLEKINFVSNKHILTLIGTTGVGKTYCANFIKRGFKPNQIYEINLESYDSKNLQLHRDVPYLLVIDNLRISDVDRIIQFLDVLPVDKSLLVLTIFNIQDTEDHSEYKIHTEHFTEIPKLFETSQYMIEAVKFNTFNENIVKDYYSILTKDNEVLEEFYQQIVDEHNFEHFGLKGFFAKLNLS